METFGMKSPPRPQRLLSQSTVCMSLNRVTQETIPCLSSTQSKTDMVGDFQAQMVDRSMSALPNVFTEVFSMQKAQTDELHKQQTVLEELRKQIRKGELKKEELEQEVKSVINRIFQCEEAIKDSKKTTRLLDSDLKVLLVKFNDKQIAIQHKEDNIKDTLRKLEKHKAKSENFKEKVIMYERNNSEVYHQIEKIKESIKNLKEQESVIDKDMSEKEKLLSGTMEQDIKTELECIQAKLNDTQDDTAFIKKQIAEEEPKQRRLEQVLRVQEKRSAAQLTRLKRQVKELQLRNRQRQSQVNQLADRVSEARSQFQQ